jgi:hypothetical protein
MPLSAQNGITALEAGAPSISPGTDYLWADSGNNRWKVSVYNAAKVLGIWPCISTSTQAGGIVYAGPTPGGGSTTNEESCLSLPNPIDPGVPLLVGPTSASAPQWGGSLGMNAISLNLQGWASVTEVLNDTTTGTTVNSLAIISTTGAIKAGTGNTAVPTYIVVAGAGNTSSTYAQLAISGQAACTMDASHTGVEGQPVFASSSIGGDCSTAATAPLGAWVLGQMVSNNTTGGSTATILARPGFPGLPLSNPTGTELATASGTLTSGHLVKFNSSGDVVDDGIALASVSGNTTIAATANSNLTSSASGDIVSVDANGNVQDSGTTPCLIQNANAGFLIPPYIFFPSANGGGTAVETTSGVVKYVQFYLPCKATLNHVSVNITSLSSGSIVLGFYSCGQSACTSTSPLVSGSDVSLSCSATGAVTGSTGSTLTLEPGIYAFAYAATDTSCATNSQSSSGWMAILNQNGSKRQGTGANSLSSGALQSTLGTLSTSNQIIIYSLWEP